MQRSLGLTLLELLLSLSIGLILTTLLLKIYSTQLMISNTLQDQLFLQTHSRLAWLILTDDIQTAGYIGCQQLKSGMTQQLTPQNFLDVSIAQQITVRQLATQALIGNPNRYQWIGIANCQQLQIVSPAKLATLNTQGQYIAPLLIETFSLKPIKNAGKSHWALYKKINQDNAVELVAGIDKLTAVLKSPRLLEITLHLTAPQGATLNQTQSIALREVT